MCDKHAEIRNESDIEKVFRRKITGEERRCALVMALCRTPSVDFRTPFEDAFREKVYRCIVYQKLRRTAGLQPRSVCGYISHKTEMLVENIMKGETETLDDIRRDAGFSVMKSVSEPSR